MWLRALVLWLLPALALAGTANLSWVAPTTRVGGSAYTNPGGFRLYERCGTGLLTAIALLPASATAYQRTVIPDEGVTCWWSLTAFDTDGLESARSNEASKTFPVIGTLPGAASNLVITWCGAPATGPPSMATHVGGVQGSASGSGTGLNTSSSLAVQAGDVILVASKWEGAVTTDAITDNAAGGSNVYTGRVSHSHPDGEPHGFVHTAIAKASETLTFTQTLGAARVWRSIHVAVGRPAASKTFAYDNAASANSPSGADNANPATGAYAVAGIGGYAAAFVAEFTSRTYTPGTGWTELSEAGSSYSEYRVLTTETSINGDATLDSAMRWVATSAAFKEVADGVVGPASLVKEIHRSIGP